MPASLPRPLRQAALLLVALASGCASSQEQFAPVCPRLSLLRDAGDLTRFAGPEGGGGGAHDARDLVLTARISAVPAHCANAPNSKVKATLNVAADIRRGPAAKSGSFTLPYFIALTEGDRVLTERDFVLTATFPPNVDQTRATGEEIDILLPVSKTKTAAAYHIYVGFRLTPSELAYNRKMAGE
jgi:hypothetical protein